MNYLYCRVVNMALQLIQLALVNLHRPKPICAGAADVRAFTRLLFASMNDSNIHGFFRPVMIPNSLLGKGAALPQYMIMKLNSCTISSYEALTLTISMKPRSLLQTLCQENQWHQWLALVDVVTSIQESWKSCAGWQGCKREQSLFRSRQEGSRGPRLFDYMPNSTDFWRALQETYDVPTMWDGSRILGQPTWPHNLKLNQNEDLFHPLPWRAWMFGI